MPLRDCNARCFLDYGRKVFRGAPNAEELKMRHRHSSRGQGIRQGSLILAMTSGGANFYWLWSHHRAPAISRRWAKSARRWPRAISRSARELVARPWRTDTRPPP